MDYSLHILNGDQLAQRLQGASFFKSYLVFREALIVGPVQGVNLDKFWENRAEFIASNYGVTKEEYRQKTILEIERLDAVREKMEICLWFEDDLFCQVNLWFLLSLITKKPRLKLFRVFPPISTPENRWAGFGQADLNSIEDCYQARVPLTASDVALGTALWQAYSAKDWNAFKNLSLQSSPCFQYLEEVGQAQLDRLTAADGMGKPERILHEIIASGVTDFSQLFQKFNRQAGIYGFGDLQVNALYEKVQSKS